MHYKIHRNDSIASNYYRMSLIAPEIARSANPGQFLMLRINSFSFDPLLRRPISIMNAAPDGLVEIVYKVVGRGTKLLSELVPDQPLDVLGPFGNSFITNSAPHRAILIGGGVGIPPLFFLAAHLKSNPENTIEAFLGGRSASDILLDDDFASIGIIPVITTEDGSRGAQGLITQPAFDTINSSDRQATCVYGCGPQGMLRAISIYCERSKIPSRLALEAHMACAVGACLGCVIDTNTGQRRICRDGPVFDGNILEWTTGA